MAFCYLNGALMPPCEARIDPRDRGFRFGDGIFETIPFYSGQLYQAELHFARLTEGLSALKIPAPNEGWQKICTKLIEKNHLNQGFIRIAISRGVGSSGYRPAGNPVPTIYIEVLPRRESPASMSLWCSRIRKMPPECLPTACKLAQGLNAALALEEADTNGADEALMLSAQGELCEAASANLFWIKDNQLYTPAESTGCLPGTTRAAVLRLYHGKAHEVSAPIDTLASAEAVFLSNCNWGLMPVTRILPQGWEYGAQHPLLRKLQLAYSEDIAAQCQS